CWVSSSPKTLPRHSNEVSKENIMRRNLTIIATLTITLLFLPGVTFAGTPAAFHDGMRKLWEDHVTWTRLFIISAAADLPDKNATTQRLLQNQTDIGNAVADFYGHDAGSKLTALLKDHILIAANIVAAAK